MDLVKIFKFEELFKTLDNSKIFLAFIFLIHLVGCKYIEEQIGEGLRNILKHTWAKGILIFCATFTITKSTKISLYTAGLGFIIFRYLLQDDSVYCILPSKKKVNVEAKKKEIDIEGE
tara:strand:+ start:345 stop:698 length:354 start_codon:yes stop_codon:yes gene_type:complete